MKRTIKPLLAVALAACGPAFASPVRIPTLAVKPRMLPTGSPACANVLDKVFSTKDVAYQRCLAGYPEEPARPPAPPARPSRVEIVVAVSSALHAFGVGIPRVLSNGAPACGNVASRSATPVRRTNCLPREWLAETGNDN
jgi:hypothetical protein